MTENLRSTVWQ